jgi:hypothetical protein
MIRPFTTELALFVTPFLLYGVFLWATRAGVLYPEAWTLPRLASLTIVAFILMIGSFVFLAEFGGAPPDSVYVPAHWENGELTPGHYENK